MDAQPTRTDIANLLASIGAPGEMRDEKVEAVKQLKIINFQGVPLEDTLETYQEW
jgi:hypothetical protein